ARADDAVVQPGDVRPCAWSQADLGVHAPALDASRWPPVGAQRISERLGEAAAERQAIDVCLAARRASVERAREALTLVPDRETHARRERLERRPTDAHAIGRLTTSRHIRHDS